MVMYTLKLKIKSSNEVMRTWKFGISEFEQIYKQQGILLNKNKTHPNFCNLVLFFEETNT